MKNLIFYLIDLQFKNKINFNNMQRTNLKLV